MKTHRLNARESGLHIKQGRGFHSCNLKLTSDFRFFIRASGQRVCLIFIANCQSNSTKEFIEFRRIPLTRWWWYYSPLTGMPTTIRAAKLTSWTGSCWVTAIASLDATTNREWRQSWAYTYIASQ